ncbi:ATP-binding protein [Sphingomonas sp. MMS12-HWE2-04]|uniref:ATP-binding protein n=1 Tax=Sphingomonas sp. MMS12-HWE2-04 TaxID=3234199 RepID=UPI0038512BEB
MSTRANAALLAVERIALRLDRAEAGDFDAEALDAIEKRLDGAEGETRNRLRALFSLAPAEIDALDATVAVAVEPALGPRIAALQGLPHALLPTSVALRQLFGHGAEPVPRSGSPLLAWRLIAPREGRPGEPAMLEADPAIVEWYFALPSLVGIEGLAIRRAEAPSPLAEWAIGATVARIKAAMAKRLPVRVLVHGLDGSGRSGLAAALAKALGLRALAISIGDAPTADAVARVQRLALMMGKVAPIWRGDPRSWPPETMLAPVQFVTLDTESELPRLEGAIDLAVTVPPLAPDSRDRLARELLPAEVAAALSPLGAPRLSDLSDAAALGVSDPAAFHAFLHQRTRERVKGVGQIVATRYGWNDLILPEQVKALLRTIESEARARDALLADPDRRRLFEGTAALTALFAGPPGTGKSMAGQVVAAALSLDLLVIDTGAVSSKYIGETAKNMTNAFAVAREANCAIMFEEADGLFARRVENDSVNARHANADTGHLLQLIESHRHLVMLSTNRRGNIDTAFLRRLRFIVDFAMPEEIERAALWRQMLRAMGVPKKALETLVAPIAAAHVLSGAQIKSAALSAAFLAGGKGAKITPELVLAGIRRELAKEGRIGEIVTPISGGRRARG